MVTKYPTDSFLHGERHASKILVQWNTAYSREVARFRPLNLLDFLFYRVAQMAATDVEGGGYPPEIIGYAEPWIVAPGDSVAIKVRTPPLLL